MKKGMLWVTPRQLAPTLHPHQPPLALPRLLCPSLDVCSTQHHQTQLSPCCWPRASTKRYILGLGGSTQSTVSCPDDYSLGVGCCKAVDGQMAKKPAYSEHGHPTVQPPDWDSCTSLPMVWTKLNGMYCCKLFKLVHLSSKHHKYGGEQLKIASSMFLKKMFSCSAGCRCCYETKYFPSTVISLLVWAMMLFITV